MVVLLSDNELFDIDEEGDHKAFSLYTPIYRGSETTRAPALPQRFIYEAIGGVY